MRRSSVVGAVRKREIVPSVVRGRTLRGMSREEWAAAHAAELLSELPGRWLHTEGVLGSARRASEAMAEDEGEMLVAAAYLHDIGYAPTLARTGFHPLDGALYLRELGEERLAGLVAYHSGAEVEARLRGLGDQLTQFDRELSEVADALTYCDVTTAPDGSVVGVDDRLADIEDRRDADDLVVVALRVARPEIQRAVDVIEARLARMGERLATRSRARRAIRGSRGCGVGSSRGLASPRCPRVRRIRLGVTRSWSRAGRR